MKQDITKYQKLSDRDHILKRSAVYLGSSDSMEFEEYFLEDGKFNLQKVKYVPGFLKIINEIIDNSVDEAIRTKYEYSNKINISIDKTSITITDNGRGIPIEKMQGTEEYIPVVLFTEAKAGSNFDDEQRTTTGLNGLGSTITNVFSKKFIVTTQDGKKKLTLTCVNNNESFKYKISESTKNGTEVCFEPDLARFGLKEIEEIYVKLVEQRLYFLSIIHPLIKFTLNNDKIKIGTIDSFIKSFSEDYEVIKNENYFIAITPNDTDDFRCLTYVNGLFIKEGGNHVSYIMSEIVTRVKEKISKKFPEIKNGDIRNKMRLIVFFNEFNNPKYNSQTKETLTNSYSEIKNYLGEIDYDKFCSQINKNDSIMDPIIEIYKIKEEFKKRQDLKSLAGNKKKNIEKFLPPTESNKYLALVEGDSALSGLLPVLGRKEVGYFPLRGKPLNTCDISIGKILSNEELKNIISIMGVNISESVQNMDFENILIAADQDLDGILIRGLCVTFFQKYTPDLLKQGRIKYLKTPMIVLQKKKKIEHWFFNFTEYNDWLKTNSIDGYDFKYYKGLGTWNAKDLKDIIEKVGLDTLTESFEIDENSQESVKHWMGGAFSDKRKEYLRGREFNIEKL